MPILRWINDGDARCAAKNVPFHLLEFVKTYGKPAGVLSTNVLIHGDNLLALRALLPFYRGKVKCIYIDPPYNTGSAFEHYDDNLEHSQWLSTLYPRLCLLREFLTEDGSIWVSIDDDEQAYLKVLLDEIFGRHNFVSTVVWQKIHSIKNDAKYLSNNHDFILVYAKNKERVQFKLLERTAEMNARYKNPDNDSRGPWQSGDLVANEERVNGYFDVISPKTGKAFNVPKGKHWVYSQENIEKMISENRLYFGKDGNAFPRKKRFLSEVMDGRKCDTWWISEDCGHNQEAKREIISIFGKSNVFATPKPERLISRVIAVATNEGDTVLDSFLGSDTTAAVAHKLGRHYIGIEMGEHAKTHCIPRLQKVIEGEQGGISESVHWQGGGSFSFYELGEPVFDAYGNINPKVTFETLAGYLWQKETKTTTLPEKKPFLGEFNGVGIYLLYNGILGNNVLESGNVLTRKLMKSLLAQYPHQGPKIIYADAVAGITAQELEANQITFKQIPYDVRG